MEVKQAGMLLGIKYKPPLDEWSKSDIFTNKSDLFWKELYYG
jgi:hypothetical protein